jgi:hypothetical protein
MLWIGPQPRSCAAAAEPAALPRSTADTAADSAAIDRMRLADAMRPAAHSHRRCVLRCRCVASGSRCAACQLSSVSVARLLPGAANSSPVLPGSTSRDCMSLPRAQQHGCLAACETVRAGLVARRSDHSAHGVKCNELGRSPAAGPSSKPPRPRGCRIPTRPMLSSHEWRSTITHV